MGTETSTGGQRHCYRAVVSYAPACVTDGGVIGEEPDANAAARVMQDRHGPL